MPSLNRNQRILAALTAAILLMLIAFLTIPAPAPVPVPHPLQVGILGQTNNPSGATMAIVGVTNHTGQAQFFYVLADIPTSNGWWTAASNQRQWGRLTARAECRVLLQVPEGAARWKLRCTSMPEVSKPEALWYVFVRQTGLSRAGFRDQPPASYVWTTEMNP